MLYKRGKVYWAKFKAHGQTFRKSTGESDRRKAEKKARQLQADIESGPPPIPPTGTLLSDMAAADIQRARNRGTTEGHVKALESLWSVVLRDLNDLEISTITFDTLESYVGKRRSTGIRGQTIRRELSAVKRALQIAKRRELLAALPEEWPTVRSDPPHPGKRGKLIPVEAIDRVFAELPSEVRDAARFSLLTGLRATEVQRAESRWVEPAPPGSEAVAILRIPAAGAKNRRERVVGLSQGAVDIIHRRLQEDPTRLHLFTQGELKKALQRASKRAGLGFTVTMRDMRHTHASLAIAGQVDPTALQEALGHRDLRTTQMYLSSTVERATSASVAVAKQLKGAQQGGHNFALPLDLHSNVVDLKKKLEQATRFELATLSLGS